MSTSQFCIQQRQQEQQQIKKILTFGFASSALLHGILVLALPQWSVESPKVAKSMELIIVEQPKPQPKPIPETKIEPKPIVEPKPKPELKPEPVKTETLPSPVKSPEPVKTETPPPPVKRPEPIEPQSTPPKLSTKRVLTSPTPAPSQPIISRAISDDNPTSSLNSNFKAANSTVEGSSDQGSSTGSSSGVPSAVAASSEPPRPQVSEDKGISCISNCEPEYPAALAGAEGSAGIKLTIDAQGNIIGAELVSPHSNSQLNRQALLAAREMKFSSPGNSSASVQVTINFTVAGSEYDRIARQKQKERERERAEQEAARQRQLEQERAEQEAARQRQLEQERAAKARREQLERERQTEFQPSQQPIPNNQTKPKPLPALETEADDEMLQKFRERIDQHQKN
ncbi:unknown protein [Stanieria sp. NIES-3757]|nr:unknown protein [Stanieria sp. NIES-3757]